MHHDHEHEGCCHSHEEGHAHEHHHEHGCAACGSCNADPKAELKALMKYMVGHNAFPRERAGPAGREAEGSRRGYGL